MDAFREPSPEEAKMIALQFLGQTQGFVKELDNHIIGKTNTLRGNTLNIKEIVGSLPSQNQPPVLRAQPQQSQQPVPQPQAPMQYAIPSQPQENVQPNQLIDILTKISSNIEVIVKLLDK
jgi:hypothetical protein